MSEADVGPTQGGEPAKPPEFAGCAESADSASGVAVLAVSTSALGYAGWLHFADLQPAYFEWLDESLRKKEERFGRDLESLRQKNPPDLEKQRGKLEADLQAEKREHAAKTAICKDQMTNPSWRETRKNEVLKRIGVDKKGNPIEPRQ